MERRLREIVSAVLKVVDRIGPMFRMSLVSSTSTAISSSLISVRLLANPSFVCPRRIDRLDIQRIFSMLHGSMSMSSLPILSDVRPGRLILIVVL